MTSDQMKPEKKREGQEVREEVRWEDILEDDQRREGTEPSGPTGKVGDPVRALLSRRVGIL